MKKNWKLLSGWLLFFVLFNTNYFLSKKEFLGVPYNTLVAEFWILENILLFFFLMLFFVFKSCRGRQKFYELIFNPEIREFFKFNRVKFFMALGMCILTFFLGMLLTLIKSTRFETLLAVMYYGFAPEYTLFASPFMDWVDVTFIFQTVVFMLLKWSFIYCVSAYLFKKKKINISPEISSGVPHE